MKIEQIQYLLEINKLHSISAASRSLHVGQTTLSAVVKATEEEVGFPIFQRTPNGVTATPMGERFMTLAWEIAVKYEQLLALRQRITGRSSVVTVLMSSSAALCLAIPLMERYYTPEQSAGLSFEEYPSEQIGKRILDNEANIGVSFLSEEDIRRLEMGTDKNQLRVERLLDDEMMLLVSEKHRFAGRDYVNAEEICSERIGTISKFGNDKILGRLIFNCDWRTSFSSGDLVCHAVREQNMVAFISRFYLSCDSVMDLSGLRAIPLRNTEFENHQVICLLTSKGRDLRYPEKMLRDCIRQYFKDFKAAQQKGLTGNGGEHCAD